MGILVDKYRVFSERIERGLNAVEGFKPNIKDRAYRTLVKAPLAVTGLGSGYSSLHGGEGLWDKISATWEYPTSKFALSRAVEDSGDSIAVGNVVRDIMNFNQNFADNWNDLESLVVATGVGVVVYNGDRVARGAVRLGRFVGKEIGKLRRNSPSED